MKRCKHPRCRLQAHSRGLCKAHLKAEKQDPRLRKSSAKPGAAYLRKFVGKPQRVKKALLYGDWPVARSAPKQRRTAVRRKTEAEKGLKHEQDWGGFCEHDAWVRQIQGWCAVCSCWPSELHHAKHRSQGGNWMDLVDLCRDCHRAHHDGKLDDGAEARIRSQAKTNLETHLRQIGAL